MVRSDFCLLGGRTGERQARRPPGPSRVPGVPAETPHCRRCQARRTASSQETLPPLRASNNTRTPGRGWGRSKLLPNGNSEVERFC